MAKKKKRATPSGKPSAAAQPLSDPLLPPPLTRDSKRLEPKVPQDWSNPRLNPATGNPPDTNEMPKLTQPDGIMTPTLALFAVTEYNIYNDPIQGKAGPTFDAFRRLEGLDAKIAPAEASSCELRARALAVGFAADKALAERAEKVKAARAEQDKKDEEAVRNVPRHGSQKQPPPSVREKTADPAVPFITTVSHDVAKTREQTSSTDAQKKAP